MPNHHIYHYRMVGRPYKYMTYLLMICLACTIYMLLYTNREKLEQRIIPGRSLDSLRGINVAESVVSPFKNPDRSKVFEAGEEGGDVVLKVEPYQPLTETVINALYGKLEQSKSRGRVLLKTGRRSSENQLSNNKIDRAAETRSEDTQKAKTQRPTTRKSTTTTTTTTTTTKKTTTKKTTAKPQSKLPKSNNNIHVNETIKNHTASSSHQQKNEIKTSDKNKEKTRKETNHDEYFEAKAFEIVNTQRLKRVADACAKFKQSIRESRPEAEFYHSPKHKLLYCKVAKGGCTFWEQLFSFILRPDSMKSSNYSTMYDIPRWRIHFDDDITPPSNYWWWTFRKTISNDTTRFMFTRDPFTRIWSAYVDKIWLPDFWFWMKIGNHRTLNVTDRCFYDVRFSDFVDYVSKKSRSNKHWAPVHQSCNPCEFKPHILGNMSTFVNDAKHILKTSDLDSVLSIHDHKERVRKELKMLVQYNYKRLEQRSTIFRFCKFTKKDLAYRLWRAFQINGYISKNQRFPNNLSSYDENNVLASILSNVEKYPLSHDDNASQREYYLHQAYKSVPRKLIENVVSRFEADFELFDFDKYPPFLLNEGEEPVPFKW